MIKQESNFIHYLAFNQNHLHFEYPILHFHKFIHIILNILPIIL